MIIRNKSVSFILAIGALAAISFGGRQAFAYDSAAAVAYAEQWWNDRNSSDPDICDPYKDYGDYDCANFVSQCLIAGGLDLSGHLGADSCGCIPTCTNIHDYLVNHLGATWETRPKGQVEPTWFLPGDPAIFGYSDAHPRTHAVFAVTGDATHYATCNAHSDNAHHVNISQFYTANLSFDRCTFYHIPVEPVQPPYPPSLIYPGSSSPGPEINDLTPTFQWSSGANATDYGLYIRNLDTDVLVFNSEEDYGTIIGTQFTLPSNHALEYETQYRWNMASHNSLGWSYDLGTGFSERLYFTTRVFDAPPTVDIFSVTPASVTLDNPFTISYTVSDDIGLQQTELWRANDVGGAPDWEGTDNPIITTPLSGQTSYSSSFIDAPSFVGTYWYGMHVVDNAGNWNDEQNSWTGGIPGDFGPVQVIVAPPNHDPDLSNGYVNPSSGDTNTDFYWYVDYYDQDGDSPTLKNVYIDGTSYTMSLYSGSASNGSYRYGPKNLSAGIHNYYFYFSDDYGGSARLPSSGTNAGPSVSSIGDSYEPDNTYSQANWIYDEFPQTHSIIPADDADWVKFLLSEESEMVIETSGASGDTRMWLYDSGLTQLEYNDDGGTNTFSRIDRICGVDALPAGTYYVKIDEYGNDDEIHSYDITLTVNGCGGNEGWKSPSACKVGHYGGPTTEWTNPTNAYTSDNIYAIADNGYQYEGYYNFNFDIPPDVIIKGIEVRCEGKVNRLDICENPKFMLSISKDGFDFSPQKFTSALTTSDTIVTVGGSSGSDLDLWYRDWTPDDFGSEFTVEIGASCISYPVTTYYLDSIQAKVYYTPLKGDINTDGKVDFADFAILASQWLQPPGEPSADIAPEGGDSFVDFLDLALVAEHWLE